MEDNGTKSWIEDGEKYAALGLDVKIDTDVMEGYFGPTLRMLGSGAFPISELWQGWLGSIQTDEIKNCGLFVVSKLRSDQPGVLDDETKLLQKRVWDFYVGLLLTSTFSPSHAPFILSGSRRDGEIDVRQKLDLEIPVPGLATPYPSISKRDFESAAIVSSQLERIAAANVSGGLWRLNRVLKLYVDTRAVNDILERIHQYSRCIDGTLLLQPGEGKKQFKSKSEIFVGPKHHDLMGEIYDVRSAVEHLHENKYLEIFDRGQRLELAKKELIVEYIARSTLEKIIGNPKLWGHFANTDALAAFWSLSSPDRKSIWGAPVDPLSALADFDPKYIHDGMLGGP